MADIYCLGYRLAGIFCNISPSQVDSSRIPIKEHANGHLSNLSRTASKDYSWRFIHLPALKTYNGASQIDDLRITTVAKKIKRDEG